MIDWSSIRYFTEDEFRCKCGCGRADMDEEFVRLCDELRTVHNKPLKVNSGYRCPDHNDRVSSTGRDGPHTTGKAVDFGVSGEDADDLLDLAYEMGFRGKGIHQRGDWGGRFLHLDTIKKRIWSY